MEYYKDHFGHREKHLLLLSGYKPKSDVSREIWNIPPEAPPSVPLTAVILLIMIDLHYRCMLKCIVFLWLKCKEILRVPVNRDTPSSVLPLASVLH